MIFKVKSAIGSPTLNSTQKKTKVDNRFADFALVFVQWAFSEVSIPVANYEQCKVSIGSADFHLNSVHSQNLKSATYFPTLNSVKSANGLPTS